MGCFTEKNVPCIGMILSGIALVYPAFLVLVASCASCHIGQAQGPAKGSDKALAVCILWLVVLLAAAGPIALMVIFCKAKKAVGQERLKLIRIAGILTLVFLVLHVLCNIQKLCSAAFLECLIVWGLGIFEVVVYLRIGCQKHRPESQFGMDYGYGQQDSFGQHGGQFGGYQSYGTDPNAAPQLMLMQ